MYAVREREPAERACRRGNVVERLIGEDGLKRGVCHLASGGAAEQ